MKYLTLLREADGFFQQRLGEQPQNLQCRRGFSLCCIGLFEIGAADVSMIAEGLAGLESVAKERIVSAAQRILHPQTKRSGRQPGISHKRTS